jgi:hypothetical protein
MMTNPAIVAELKRLTHANGGELKPEAVVDAARSLTSPLHQQFEWDDSEAAKRYRLEQARQLIRVIITYEQIGDGKLVPYRVFVSLTPDREKEGGGYRLATTVLSDADQRRQLLLEARDEMKRFAAKYRQLSELAQVFEAIENVVVEEPAELSTTT